jgi:hypothetical protein
LQNLTHLHCDGSYLHRSLFFYSIIVRVFIVICASIIQILSATFMLFIPSFFQIHAIAVTVLASDFIFMSLPSPFLLPFSNLCCHLSRLHFHIIAFFVCASVVIVHSPLASPNPMTDEETAEVHL